MSDRSAQEASGLAAQVVDYVRGYIAANGLRPGDRLPGEGEIARVIGVSRPVVREASRTLLALGTIVTAPGRAPRVGGMGSDVLRQVFEQAIVTGEANPRQVLEVRRGLEIAMAAQAAARRDEQAVTALVALAGAMAERLGRPDAFVALDLDFHRTLAAATGNPFYVVLIEACRSAFVASMDAGLRRRYGRAALERVHRRHAEIVDAVRCGDPGRAAEAMTRHFDDALAALYRPTRPRRHAQDDR